MSELPSSLARHPDLDTWVRVDPADTITLFTGKVELGQGLKTAIARIGAEELDVDLERVRVSTADTAHGLNELFTVGSQSMEESGAAMRQAAAEARRHLLELAAARLDAPLDRLDVTDGASRYAARIVARRTGSCSGVAGSSARPPARSLRSAPRTTASSAGRDAASISSGS